MHVTATLRDGTRVLARDKGAGFIDPLRYLARAVAQRKADAIGGTVRQLMKGGAFYVVPPGGRAP